MHNPRAIIEAYLVETNLIQIATVNGARPWICTVYCAYDLSTNTFYWLSKRNTRHSQEIATNSSAAAAIVKPHTVGQPVQGIQLEGLAYEVTGSELEIAHRLYASRFNRSDELLETAKKPGDELHTYYGLKVSTFVLFDEVNYSDNPRQEWTV